MELPKKVLERFVLQSTRIIAVGGVATLSLVSCGQSSPVHRGEKISTATSSPDSTPAVTDTTTTTTTLAPTITTEAPVSYTTTPEGDCMAAGSMDIGPVTLQPGETCPVAQP
ncbi:MAG: hypothetical protein ACXWLH_04915 [Candidatus Saccharimonadales bacterium]